MSMTLAEEAHTNVAAETAYQDLLGRLSRQSVVKHFDAYADVDWDAPEMAIDPEDPRWEVSLDDPLTKTDWYQSQPPEVRARMGLHRVVNNMKIGLQFERVLKRGLLEYAGRLPDGAPEFRYAYHEIIEEAQHSLMFQEFVNRSGLPSGGMSRPLQIGARRVVKMGARFPELFFLFVLAGEDPIDFVQRSSLRRRDEIHPLLERIMRIHVTEEARHLSFARHYLKHNVPQLGFAKRQILAVQTPCILGTMSSLMLRPSRLMIRTYHIPRPVLRAAYKEDPTARQYVVDSLQKVRTLCVDLGIVNPVSKMLWKGFGIWGDVGRQSA